ncbi:MAG: SRPBCC family protein [Parvularculaceae bacterium]
MGGYTYEYELPVTFPATPRVAFSALSEAGVLARWFAQNVEIDPRIGGAFRFWGAHTFGAQRAEQATQKILAYDPPRSLSFSWRFLDQDTEVTWSLCADGDNGSRITVRHFFPAAPEGVRVKEMIDDLWRLYTGNLGVYLKGGRDFYLPDFDDPSPQVVQEIVIDAPPEKVFAALTRPELISKWFPAPAPVVEPRVGGKYGFGFSYKVDGVTVEPPPMTILAFEQNKTLSITWPDWRGDANVPDQSVTWTLEALGGGRTRLVLVHAGFVRSMDVSDYPFGWGEFMGKIGEVACAG